MGTTADAVDPPAVALRNELAIPKGNVVFRRGDPGDSMFIIEAGRIQILLENEGKETAVAVLGPGEFFGELSLLSNAPRTATAEALEDSRLLVVGRPVFAMMMQDDLEIVFRMLHTMGERLGRLDRQFWELMRCQGRLVLLTELLRAAESGGEGRTGRLAVEQLAVTLRRDSGSIRTAIAELVAAGAGVLEDGWWRVEGPAHVRTIVELLRSYAGKLPAAPADPGA